MKFIEELYSQLDRLIRIPASVDALRNKQSKSGPNAHCSSEECVNFLTYTLLDENNIKKKTFLV